MGDDAPGAATFRAPAEAYDRHIGRYGRELARALIAAAGVRRGRRAVDVGCGPGALTAELAALIGAERVAAVDPSVPFAEACRRRLPGVRVEVAAAEALPFDGRGVRSRARAARRELHDRCAGGRGRDAAGHGPRGTVAAAVWDYAGEMTLLRRFWDAAVALDPAAAEHDEGRSMRFCTPEELGELWTAAGLAGVDVSPVVVSAGYEGFDDLWQPLERGVAPSGAYAVSLPPERRAALKAEFQRRLGVGSEPFRLTARAWIVSGRVA